MAISQKWWDRWWEKDYSWDGLAKKVWEDWVVPEDGVPVPAGEGVKGRQATLQDYWRRAELAEDVERPEFQCPQTKRRFTRVHLPLEFRDGSQTLKGAKDDAFRAELDEILKAELAKPIVETEHTSYGVLESPDNRLQWQGAVLLDFDLAGLSTQTRSKDERIPMSLQAMNAAFSGNASFQYAAFSGDANFYSAVFCGYADFYSAVFSGDADFKSAAFSGDAWFSNAAFLGKADFSGEGRSLTSERVEQSIMLSSQSGDKGLSFEGQLKGDPAPLSITRRSVQRLIAKGAVFLGAVDFSNRAMGHA
ncbi:MAG: hypothetical protein CMF04_11875 [Hyphomonas sp.]|nr:hypothetical protein [Hyphomonas sp.]